MNTPDIQTLAGESARLYYAGAQLAAINLAEETNARLDDKGRKIFIAYYQTIAKKYQEEKKCRICA